MSETVTYTYLPPAMPGMNGIIKRSSDNAFIPMDLGNRDYQQFLNWIADGNTLEGWDGPTNESAS